jgi:hypothetical protein
MSKYRVRNRPPGEKRPRTGAKPFKRSLKKFCHSEQPSANGGLERQISFNQLTDARPLNQSAPSIYREEPEALGGVYCL